MAGNGSVNECSNGTAHCDAHATCTDTASSFLCTCDDGYSGDGMTCSPNVARAIVAGNSQTCAISTANTVRCWGLGYEGVLGYGNTNSIGDDETPASAGDVDIGGPVQQIAAGNYSTCALLATGNVRCWGYDSMGELGYGTHSSMGAGNIGDNETPASAGDLDIGGAVKQLAAGNSFACALLTTGNVRCWGDASLGDLGYGRNTGNIGDDETPASAGDLDIGGPVAQITAGGYHACALLTTGNVRCWGANTYGELGRGNGDQAPIGVSNTPASQGDIDIGGPVKQIAAGEFHTCALLTTGKVRCWGYPYDGQLGYGNMNIIGDDETPAAAGDIDVGGTVTQLAARGYHTCALLTTGNMRCWGGGDHGELGHGNLNGIGDDETPASAGDIDVGGAVQQIAPGEWGTCALLTTGKVRCWGRNFYGELGYGNLNDIGDDETPASAGDVSVF